MDDSFTMTITINPLVSPLLHAELTDCASARQRAMRLRALAEAALRGPTQRGQHDGTLHHPSSAVVERSRAPLTATPETGVQILRVDDAATGADGLDSGSLSDQLAAFL